VESLGNCSEIASKSLRVRCEFAVQSFCNQCAIASLLLRDHEKTAQSRHYCYLSLRNHCAIAKQLMSYHFAIVAKSPSDHDDIALLSLQNRSEIATQLMRDRCAIASELLRDCCEFPALSSFNHCKIAQ
jgi:hypothetical protein